MATPLCTLCQGKLVLLQDVHALRGDGVPDYHLAWVCTMCSAAFPVAVRKKLFGGALPLYEDGKAYDE